MVHYHGVIEIDYVGGQSDERDEVRQVLAAALAADSGIAQAGPTLEIRPGSVLLIRE